MTKTRPDGPRDLVAGSETGPEKPFPIRLNGPVVEGFGRGSRELGIPTANIPPTGLSAYPDLESGVYFGFVGLRLSKDTTQPADNSKLTLSASAQSNDVNTTTTNFTAPTQPHNQLAETTVGVYEAVLSIGYNPFYNNTTRSIEIHILHPFPTYNFYHSPLNLLILGFIRPEYNYDSLDLLVQDIKMDCEVAKRSLERVAYRRWKGEAWLRGFEWVSGVDVGELEREEKGGGEGGSSSGIKEEGKL